MTLSEGSVRELIAAIRSPTPTPGGGSASALAAALGSALLAMVAGLRPATTDRDDLERLAVARQRASELSDELLWLVDRDAAAYEAVIGAYRLPKDTDAEKTRRSEQIQEALETAIASPMEVMRLCTEAAEHATIVASFGNANAASDVRVGVELLTAGLRGAKANVEINLNSLKNGGRVEAIRGEVLRLTQKFESDVESVQARL